MIVVARVEMGKSKKTQFICHSCGHVSLRWLGRCPDCNKWDSLVEERKTTLNFRCQPARTNQ